MKPPTHELHGACLVPTKEPEARMNETAAAAYQPGPVFRTRMNKGRAQCEECGEWLDDCRCVDYVPERRRRESLSSRLAALEAENQELKKASQQARRHLAQAQRFLTLFWTSDQNLGAHIRPQLTKASECLSGRARAVWEKEGEGK